MVSVKSFFSPSCGFFLSWICLVWSCHTLGVEGTSVQHFQWKQKRNYPSLSKSLCMGKGWGGNLGLGGLMDSLLELFEVLLFGPAPLCLGVTQELPARRTHVFSKKERRLRGRICEFYPCCFGRKSVVKRTQTIRAYAEFVHLQKPVVGVPVHWCSAINNKGRQQLTTCLLRVVMQVICI